MNIKLNIVIFVSVILAGLFSLPLSAMAVPGEGSFEGRIQLNPIGNRKARLHIRSTAQNEVEELFGVLAIADERGDYGAALIYRFNEVRYDVRKKQYFMRLIKPANSGVGNSIYTLTGVTSQSHLSGIFRTNQIAPDGTLVEGPFQFDGVFEG